MDLSGKTVVVTGASRGIGASAARVFADAGANVALLARSAAPLEALAAEIGTRALALSCDVADYAAVEAALMKAKSHFGGLDILIANAGMIDPIARLIEADPADWAQLIQVNISGVFNIMRAGVPMMDKQGGTVISIGSGAAQRPLEGWSAYCSSKAGSLMLMRALDLEERENGLRVMSLSPGTVATQMQREIKASGINAVSQLDWEDHIPPEWPAQTLLWMCSADADEYLGAEVSLRDETVRRRVGLI
ncbi:Glucose 1-dehydrogenase 2 [Tritonibacter multivorans]|uniref:Glucose 1-dehydrogenase 2 n=1 Tax=Tritonibacter multivorans TaxID=928856 RepID=A0A0P1GD42_9RHOB|nr:SDR family oxidoreductase [Tritonibacter multivorans]MDA7419937.1 SDR family oxidoreductase [Tritonibacter multivorans]CUH79357.1 Glucose 1-dehydrogenase 2 [Tritonibacter multivorans]SFC11097.1 NADP-dependent 3-hydroxy acid dehydrogenase YdfG [Tritonibacter multivorans]